MNNKEMIKNMYFKEKLDTVEIADRLGITKQAVSKTLNTKWKEEYIEEKICRQKQNKENRGKKNNDRKKNKRAQENKNDEMEILELMKQQACNATDMSTSSRLNDRQAVFLNKSAYKMNKTNTRLVYNNKLGAKPADLPPSFSLKVYF